MSQDRITQLRISGLRVIRDVTLELRGLTVLIGDNGTGKSSILEALELLRQAAKPISYVHDVVVKAHGNLRALLRRGETELRLGITVEGEGPKLEYDFSIGNVGTAPVVLSERVQSYPDPSSPVPRTIFTRHDGPIVYSDYMDMLADAGPFGEQELALPRVRFSTNRPDFDRLVRILNAIEVHFPFEARPLWQQRELGINVGPRWPALVEQSSALARYGVNLPNAYQQLRNLGDDTWSRVLERARLGLGDDVRNFRLPPSGRGNIELEVVFGSSPDHPVPAESLSEGQLCYLAFIALSELNHGRSVLAFDEPELHLHPSLLARVVWMLEQVAETTPVVLATHSDRLLDALAEPEASVVLCDLDDQQALRLRRPNAERLASWLRDYRGLGSVRAEGYESHVFADSNPEEPEA